MPDYGRDKEFGHVLTGNGGQGAGIDIAVGSNWMIEACRQADVERMATVLGGVAYRDPVWRPVALPPNLPATPTYEISDVESRLAAHGLGCDSYEVIASDGVEQCPLFQGTARENCTMLDVSILPDGRKIVDNWLSWALYTGTPDALVVGGNWAVGLCHDDPALLQQVQAALGGVILRGSARSNVPNPG